MIHIKSVSNFSNISTLELSDQAHAMVRIRIPTGQEVCTKYQTAKASETLEFNEKFTMLLKNVTSTTNVTIELIARDKQIISTTSDTMNLTEAGTVKKLYELKADNRPEFASAWINYEWTEDLKKTKKNKKMSTSLATTMPATLSTSESNDFARPCMFRIGYYYTSGKGWYDYTKSFKVMTPLATMGESSVNYVLSKLNVKDCTSTDQIDNHLVPWIDQLDIGVDKKLASVCDLLVRGQTSLLDTKDMALNTIVSTKDHAAIKWSALTSSTKESLSTMATTTSDSITKAKESTLHTVSSVSAATYNRVSGAAVLLISYVPIVGPKMVQ